MSVHCCQKKEQIYVLKGNKHHDWIISLTNWVSWMKLIMWKYGNNRCPPFLYANIYVQRQQTLCQARWTVLKSRIYSQWSSLTSRGEKEKWKLREKNRRTSSNYDWPINRVGCQCQWAQLWTAGNSSSGGTLLKRSSTVRSGHSPKVYMRSQGAWLTLAEENNKSSALYRLTLKTVPMWISNLHRDK